MLLLIAGVLALSGDADVERVARAPRNALPLLPGPEKQKAIRWTRGKRC